ncbi:hypothetical protein [Leucobacter chromiireducens]|uniref:hypothetical protein n=1 Tax=Leucobacter chromiireducens TaxID=283877 RepID=UPI000F63F550|nr:hypothetical protein [Leucobacter chromiireducens]
MALNIAQAKEQQDVSELEAELLDLNREREDYLHSVSDRYAPVPIRTLSEIRDAIEIAQARLDAAKKTADKKKKQTATADTVRATLSDAVSKTTAARTRVQEAAQAVDAAIAALRNETRAHNEIISNTRSALLQYGIPTEGAELDNEPIEIDTTQISHGDTTLRAYSPRAVSNYLTATFTTTDQFPEEPQGWSLIRGSYAAGNYWRHGAHIN